MEIREELQELLKCLGEIPPVMENAEEILKNIEFDSKELAYAAAEVTDDYLYKEDFDGEEHNRSYIIEILKLFLKYGLDPNEITKDGENVMWSLAYMDDPDIVVFTARLLLENGANPNNMNRPESRSLIDFVVFDNVYDDRYFFNGKFEEFYWSNVKYALILMAYGGLQNGKILPVKMLDGRDISIFKHAENFDFYYEMSDDRPCYWYIYIFDKKTKEVVAVWE